MLISRKILAGFRPCFKHLHELGETFSWTLLCDFSLPHFSLFFPFLPIFLFNTFHFPRFADIFESRFAKLISKRRWGFEPRSNKMKKYFGISERFAFYLQAKREELDTSWTSQTCACTRTYTHTRTRIILWVSLLINLKEGIRATRLAPVEFFLFFFCGT